MSTTIATSMTEQEFKYYLKQCLLEIFNEGLPAIGKTIIAPEQAEILNVKEAAEYLRFKVSTLYEKTSLKQIPHFKKGNKLFFKRQDLKEWVQQGRVSTKSEIGDKASLYLEDRDHKRKVK